MRERWAEERWSRVVSAGAHSSARGGRKRPVPLFALEGMEKSTTVSTGPPVSHASTGNPQAPASMGTIPKCSLAGVYKSARVDGEVSRWARWAEEKLSRNIICVLGGIGEEEGMVCCDREKMVQRFWRWRRFWTLSR